MPMSPPTRKVMAASWKGGTPPDAAVRKASTAHMRTAVNPMSVAVVRDKEASGNRSHTLGENGICCKRETAASQIIYCPPLAVSTEPVMKPAWSETRKTTQRATSSGWPRRPTGICGMTDFSSTSFGTAITISVAI